MDEKPVQPETTATRAVHLMLAAVIALAFVGFFVGIRQGTPSPTFEPRHIIVPEEFADALPAMSYAEFDRRKHGPNAGWKSSFIQLQQPETDLLADPGRREENRQAFFAARADRRAFDGAPPVVPHPVDQMTSASCVACHSEGTFIGRGVRATVMSHEFMPNCTQCHVEQLQLDLGSYVFRQNIFDGLESGQGRRAWDGAPPTVPHSVFMRENCLSCHGVSGPSPIRTTHPWQTNCLQCHAPSAVSDQFVRDDQPSMLPPIQQY